MMTFSHNADSSQNVDFDNPQALVRAQGRGTSKGKGLVVVTRGIMVLHARAVDQCIYELMIAVKVIKKFYLFKIQTHFTSHREMKMAVCA